MRPKFDSAAEGFGEAFATIHDALALFEESRDNAQVLYEYIDILERRVNNYHKKLERLRKELKFSKHPPIRYTE